jgi:lipopolysaccharide transport system ATP-binding protein
MAASNGAPRRRQQGKPAAPAIACREITKTFSLGDGGAFWRIALHGAVGDVFTALVDVTLEVPKGQFVGLLGRNGAGKSTLLRTIGGIYTPTAGVVALSGAVSAIYELGMVGNDRLSGRHFAERWFSLYGRGGYAMDALCSEIADFSELGDYFDRPIYTYSSGMKARLFFATATALPGQLYLIDEVLSVGDEHFQNKCWRRLRERLSTGASGLLATHDWSAILRLCERAYILDHGRIIAGGASPVMVQQYLGFSTFVPQGGRFRDDQPTHFDGVTGEDALLCAAIEITDDTHVFCGCAIEVFRPGFGWDHLLHAEPTFVARGPGRYDIEIRIPSLPLAPGGYAVAIGITARDGGNGPSRVVDARSWAYGNGLTLHVSGPPRDSLMVLPVQWRSAPTPR